MLSSSQYTKRPPRKTYIAWGYRNNRFLFYFHKCNYCFKLKINQDYNNLQSSLCCVLLGKIYKTKITFEAIWYVLWNRLLWVIETLCKVSMLSNILIYALWYRFCRNRFFWLFYNSVSKYIVAVKLKKCIMV